MTRLMRLSRLSIILVIYLACAGYGSSAFAQKLDAGGSRTCALMFGGGVKCWGWNRLGELGNGTTTDSSVPVPVNNLGGQATAVTAGTGHTCALLSDGTVRCWGLNDFGQLGNGTTTNLTVPGPIINPGAPFAAIAAGGRHTCGLLASGSVLCWGSNLSGQLGNGRTTNSSVPVAVSFGGPATAIAVGGAHSCAIVANGTVQCWGSNSFRQLGNGTTTNSSVPVTVNNVRAALAITAGDNHTCALLSGGGVLCWGSNNRGQLGNGRTTVSSAPTPVNNLGAATAVSAGFLYTCAILTSDGVRCWGINNYGQLGNGTRTNTTLPVPINNPGVGYAAITAAETHTCVLMRSGAVLCWGLNSSGQLGNGTTRESFVPVITSKVRSP